MEWNSTNRIKKNATVKINNLTEQYQKSVLAIENVEIVTEQDRKAFITTVNFEIVAE
jgi:hypothetical protein